MKMQEESWKDVVCAGGRLAGQFGSFSGVGIASTLIHLAVVVALVEGVSAHSVLANTIAFITANIFSFWANARFSFRAAPSLRHYFRFLIISFFGLLLTVILTGIAAALGWHYLLGTIIVFFALPLLTFMAHRKFTWSDRA